MIEVFDLVIAQIDFGKAIILDLFQAFHSQPNFERFDFVASKVQFNETLHRAGHFDLLNLIAAQVQNPQVLQLLEVLREINFPGDPIVVEVEDIKLAESVQVALGNGADHILGEYENSQVDHA